MKPILLIIIEKIIKFRKIFVVLVLGGLTVLFWQNCSKIQLEKLEPVSELSQAEETSYLKIPTSAVTEYRAAFIIDMSNSMYSGACPDSLDVAIENVNPTENCLGPTGVDPEGKRFKLILNWIKNLEDRVVSNQLKNESVKLMVLTFSNSKMESYWSLDKPLSKSGKAQETVLTGFISALGWDTEIKPGYISLQASKKLIYLLWAMYSHIHEAPMDREIPLAIVKLVKEKWVLEHSENTSSGTSMVLPALEKLNTSMYSELNKLKANALLEKSHFETIFLSDGVPKPHALHIEKAIRMIWAAKKEVCDDSVYVINNDCANSPEITYGWMAVNATSCAQKCSNYLKSYIDSGSANVPQAESPKCTSYFSSPYSCNQYSDGSTAMNRWSKDKISCGQCFEVINQFSYLKGACTKGNCSYSPGADTFKKSVQDNWGDWTLNRHSEIIGRLKTSENIFKSEYQGSSYKMKFIRIDAANAAFETQAGELISELNWIEKAKNYFNKKHSFLVMRDVTEMPKSLFDDLQEEQKYDLARVYIFLKNARADAKGSFSLDSDADGVIDSLEKKR